MTGFICTDASCLNMFVETGKFTRKKAPYNMK